MTLADFGKAVVAFLQLAASVTAKETLVCQKCHAFPGEVMCDRSLLGEAGACDFRPVSACRQCGSKVPCFGLPCELADRLATIRKDYPKS